MSYTDPIFDVLEENVYDLQSLNIFSYLYLSSLLSILHPVVRSRWRYRYSHEEATEAKSYALGESL